ncbi:MAG TPA: FtsX-like permease family protein, partial [Acidimicrobiales bacterium]
YPSGTSEVALSSSLANLYRIGVGGVWHEEGHRLRVVGEVRSPTDLNATFALVAPGAIAQPSVVTVLFDATAGQLAGFRPPSAIYGTLIGSIQTLPPPSFDIGQLIVLVAGTFGMLFIGLIAVAGFTVMGQRRQRAVGILDALGAAESKVRLVLLVNGFVIGFIGMVVGGIVGLGAWWLYAPHQQASLGHVVDPASIPWWLVVTALLLAPFTATLAARRPAKALSKMPAVVALSGRPNEPQASRRNALIGVSVLGAGVIIVFAGGNGARGGGGGALPLLVGIVASCVGLYLVAQWVVAQLGRVASRAPLAARIALRDLARYRSRSGAALGAICLAIVMTAVVVIAATARYSNPFDYVGPNLASNVVLIYPPLASGTTVIQPCPQGECRHQAQGPTPQAANAEAAKVARAIAVATGASSVLELETTNANPENISGGRGFNGAVYVATPALLAHYGIAASAVDANALVLSARPTLPHASGLAIVYSAPTNKGFDQGQTGPCPPGYCVPDPVVQAMPQLPAGTSAPNTVFTMRAVRLLHLQLQPAIWLVTTPAPLTSLQKQSARTIAASAGASIETASSFASLNEVLGWSILLGILVALGVLAMTVGLIRAETSGELRVLTAAGASRRTRRALTSVTAAALGFVGAVLGVVTAYLLVGAFLATNASDNLSELVNNLPIRPLAAIVLGLPLLAALGGWCFAAREPTSISRQPLP